MPNRTAADIMTKKLITLSPETDIYRAIQTLVKKNISGAPVVDNYGNLQGILSEFDCLKVVTAGAFDGLPEGKVADYMSGPARTIRADMRIFDIVQTFLTYTVRRLPVVDERGRLMGQISRRDVLRAIESIRDNTYLYGAKEKEAYPPSAGEGFGVDTAMRLARGKR